MGDSSITLKIDPDSLKKTLSTACQHGQLPSTQANGLETGMNRLSLNSDDKLARDWFVAETKGLGCFHKVNSYFLLCCFIF
jgi:hypothetical protein